MNINPREGLPNRHVSNILILGSNSFAGAATVEACLNSKMNVWGVSRSHELHGAFRVYDKHQNIDKFTFEKVDINNNLEKLVSLIEFVKPDAIIDLAGQGMVAQSWENPDQWYQTNILAKSKLHKNLIGNKHLKAYVRISTPEVYGSSDKLLSENMPYNPSTPYAVSHAATDMSLNAFYSQFDFPVMTTRFANFYGSGQQLYRIVPRTILAALGKGKLTLDGGGTSIRSFIHRRDVASGILATLRHGSLGETYHFSNDEFVSIKELVVKISNLMDVDMEDFCVDGPERMGKDQAYLMNAKKAVDELGWSSEISLSCGLIETVDWLKANIDELEKHPFEYAHQI